MRPRWPSLAGSEGNANGDGDGDGDEEALNRSAFAARSSSLRGPPVDRRLNLKRAQLSPGDTCPAKRISGRIVIVCSVGGSSRQLMRVARAAPSVPAGGMDYYVSRQNERRSMESGPGQIIEWKMGESCNGTRVGPPVAGWPARERQRCLAGRSHKVARRPLQQVASVPHPRAIVPPAGNRPTGRPTGGFP